MVLIVVSLGSLFNTLAFEFSLPGLSAQRWMEAKARVGVGRVAENMYCSGLWSEHMVNLCPNR